MLARNPHRQADHARSSTSAAQPSSSRRSARRTAPGRSRRLAAARTPEAISALGDASRRRARSSSGSVRLATTVGAHGALARHVAHRTSTSTPLRAGVAARDATPRPGRARRRRPARSPAAPRRSPARRCRSPSRPAPVARQLLQQLQAHAASSGATAAPKLGPGSITRSSSRPAIHGGRTASAPTATGSRWSCQARSQPVGDRRARRRRERRRRRARAAPRRTAARRRRPRTRRRPSTSRSSAPRAPAPAPGGANGAPRRLDAPDPDAEPDHPASARLSLAIMPSSSRRLSSSATRRTARAGRAACGSAGAGSRR